jgi:hypothetical protein
MEVDNEPAWADKNTIPELVEQKLASLDFYLGRDKWNS